jgi:hypothetical protein
MHLMTRRALSISPYQEGRLTHARHSARRRVSAGSSADAATFCRPVSPGHAVSQGLTSSNIRLDVSTFCGICWVVAGFQ